MKRRMVPTKDMTREEWLRYRRCGIGGSDASVIMGENPWRSVLQLWEEKTGDGAVTDNGNEYTYWGNVMEPIIRKEFMNRTGLKVRQKHAIIFHSVFPFLFADVDGIVTDENGEKCIFEAKTASQYKEKDWEYGVPREYYLQVQHYLEVCGMDKAYVAVLIGGNTFKIYTVLRNQEVVAELLCKEKVFWEEHVLAGIPPMADDSKATAEYLDSRYSDTVADSIQLPENMKEILQAYDAVDIQLKRLEKEKTGLSNQIKAAMEDHERGELDGMTVQWKKIERESLDSKRLKKEKPELFQEYRSVSSYRRLTVAA